MKITKKTLQNKPLMTLFFIGTLFLVASPFQVAASDKHPVTSLVRLKAQYVCMVNDEGYKKAQTPVVVDGKTYYGCCKMCELQLKKNPSVRFAVDPVSGKRVDKATAVIGMTPDGRVHYFENEAHFATFLAHPAGK